jgi:putative selenium metabolism hydrolase
MSTDLSFDAAVRFAADLIRIPGAPGEEGDVARRVRDEFETLGLTDVRIDDVGNVVGRAPGTGAAPPVMLSCHLDVVDVGDASSWEVPPFAGEIRDGWLHGRGAMDIKGPLALQTYAAARFVAHPGAGDVIVAHTVLEERGGWGMEHLVGSGEVRPGAVIIGEATAGDICIGHRGRAEMIIELTGVAGHASAPERAHNPLTLMTGVVPALDAFAATLETDDILGPSTIAATAVETLPKSRNVIPDRVRVVIDWRVLPGLSAVAAAARLEAFLLQHVRVSEPFGLTVRCGVEPQRTHTGLAQDRKLFTPGFLLDPSHPIARAAADTIASRTGRTPKLRPWTFATDGGHTCGVHGIPTIGYAPGEERFAHTNRERLDLRDARVAFDVYPDLINVIQAAL